MKKMVVLIITTLLVLTGCQQTTQQPTVEPTKEAPVIKVNAELKIGGNRPTFRLADQKIMLEQGVTAPDFTQYIVAGKWDSLTVSTIDTNTVGNQTVSFEVTHGSDKESFELAVEVVEKKQVELPNTATTTTTQTIETTTTTAQTSEPVAQVEASEPTYEPEPAPSPQPEPTPVPQPEPAPIVEAPAPVVEAPHRLWEIGNSGMEFLTFEQANQWGLNEAMTATYDNGRYKYRAYLAYTIMWSDGSQTYSVDFTLNE